MNEELSVDDIVGPPPSMLRMIGRALTRRCPRCGSGRQFHHWVKRADHCPGCGYTLDREHDSFFGAFLLNLTVCFAALFGLLILAVIFEAAERPLPITGVIVVGLCFAIVLPLVFYPFSFTLWAVVDLHSDPMRVGEIVDAVDKIDADRSGRVRAGALSPRPDGSTRVRRPVPRSDDDGGPAPASP